MRLPLVSSTSLTTDQLDPITGALRVLGALDPFVTKHPIFGYGRDLSAIPLVLGASGLHEVFLRRAVLQAVTAPLVLFGTLVLLGSRPRALFGATVAGAAVALHPALLRVLTGDYQGYFAPEWGAVAAVGLVGLLRGEHLTRSALLTGLALPMMAFSTPHAMAGGALLLVAMAAGWRRPGVRRAALIAAGTGAILMLPHVLLVTRLEPEAVDGVGQTLIAAARARGSLADGGPLTAASLYLYLALRPASLALFAGPAAALALGWRRSDPATRATALLGAGLIGADIIGITLTVFVGHSMPWHWLPLLPAHAICLGAVIVTASERMTGTRGRGLLLAGGVVTWLPILVSLPVPDRPPEDIMRLGRMQAVASVLPDPSVDLVGYQLRTSTFEPAWPQLFPLALDAHMRGVLAVPRPDRIALLIEGPADRITRLDADGLPGHTLTRAPGFILLLADPEEARRLGEQLCAGPDELVLMEKPALDLMPAFHPGEVSDVVPLCARPSQRPKVFERQGVHQDLRDP